MNAIKGFFGRWRFLSNFYWLPYPIEYEGISYPTVEHAFQAQKTLDDEERKRIAKSKTPGHAKRMGKHVELRYDWDEVKDKIMLELVALKFEIPSLRKMLIDTKDLILIEWNTWNDKYWGVNESGEGENKLGKILMFVRKKVSISSRKST